jgi:hypothetical protein
MSRSGEVEYANGRHIEARSLAKYMLRNGAPRNVALRAQAAAEVNEEVPSNADKDMVARMVEHRFQILQGEVR